MFRVRVALAMQSDFCNAENIFFIKYNNRRQYIPIGAPGVGSQSYVQSYNTRRSHCDGTPISILHLHTPFEINPGSQQEL